MKTNFDNLIGKWVHIEEWDTDDWMSEYDISGTENNIIIKAKDHNDGEEYEISNIKWNGQVLEFVSVMPSTGRKGINKFRIKSENELESEFTFTEYDIMKRKTT
jgi:hypothetical protein